MMKDLPYRLALLVVVALLPACELARETGQALGLSETEMNLISAALAEFDDRKAVEWPEQTAPISEETSNPTEAAGNKQGGAPGASGEASAKAAAKAAFERGVDADDLGEAKAAFEESVRLFPTAPAYFNLGVIAEIEAEQNASAPGAFLASAKHYYERALEVDPNYADARDALAALGTN